MTAVGHARNHLAQRDHLAGHLEADVEAFFHAQLGHGFLKVARPDVDGKRCPHVRGDGQAGRVHVGRDHVPGAAEACDRGSQTTHRPGARDQNILSDEVERKGSVHGVAEWIEDGQCVVRDVLVHRPDVDSGQRQILSERARGGGPDADRVRAEMSSAGATVATSAAHDVTFSRHQLADAQSTNSGAQLDNPADKFVSADERQGYGPLRPVVPFVDVHIGAADRRLDHLDQDLTRGDLRHRDLLQGKPRAGGRLHECEHLFHGKPPSLLIGHMETTISLASAVRLRRVPTRRMATDPPVTVRLMRRTNPWAVSWYLAVTIRASGANGALRSPAAEVISWHPEATTRSDADGRRHRLRAGPRVARALITDPVIPHKQYEPGWLNEGRTCQLLTLEAVTAASPTSRTSSTSMPAGSSGGSCVASRLRTLERTR